MRAQRFGSFAQDDRFFAYPCCHVRGRDGGRCRFGVFLDAGERGFDGVAEEVDEELLDLVLVGEEVDVGGGENADVESDFEAYDSFDQRYERDSF
jgi:hypothetical protein